MKTMDMYSSILSEKEQAEILGREPTILSYKLIDYDYNKDSKPRILSGLRKLDYMLKGFELGCITLWSGSTNCLDKDTEFFNGKEWKKICEYEAGEKVLQYNLDGTATLQEPLKYIKQKCDNFLSYKSKNIDMVVTENHDLVYKIKNKIYKKSAKEIALAQQKNSKGFSGKFITTFKYSGNGIDLTEEEIRVMCMVICDGSFSSKTNRCCINIKKQRKIQRAEELLTKAKIPYHKYETSWGYTRFYFYAPIRTKEFDEYWYNCNNEQFQIIADEIIYWDGSKLKGNDEFSSNNKKNIDFIQFVFTSIGIRANIKSLDRRGVVYKDKYIRKSIEYSLIISKRNNTITGITNSHKKTCFKQVESEDGYCYCFTMPSGMLVVRRGGKIIITGNSGKTTMLTLLARETVRQGNKVFFFNGEQTKDDFKNNLYKASVTKDDIYAVQYKNTSIYDYYVKDKKLLELDAIYGPKIIVFNNNVKRDIDTLLLAMEQAYNEENVKCFILDNFMQIDIEGDNIFQEQTKVMEKLRTFAVNKEVHIHLVAHPRKIENYQTRLSLYDVSGSMNIPNKAYNIVSIIRKSTVVKDSTEYKRLKIDMFEEGYDFEKSDGVLEVLKTKGNRIGLIGLTFDKTLKTYVLQEEMNSLERAQIEQEIHALKSERKKCKF